MIPITSKGVTINYGNEGLVAKDAKDALRIVREKGVAVLPGVLTPEECEAMNTGMWDTAEYLTSGLAQPLKRGRPDTYDALFHLNPNHGGLIQHFAWGHAQYVWDVRQNPKVAEMYHELYGDKPLLSSFDGVNASIGAVMPKKKQRGKFRGGMGWLHTDQRPSDSSFQCVQSWVTANDVLPGDATLRCLVGSHKLHEKMAQHFGLIDVKDDWFKYTLEQLDWFKKNGAEDICITCPAGSQVFWDSRTAHSGMEFVDDADCSKRTKPRTYRNVVYVCFQPREERTIEKRAMIFDPDGKWRLRLASHWPNKMKLFGEFPRSYGNPPPVGCKQTDPKKHWSFVPEMPMPKLTPYGIQIAIGHTI